MKKRDPSWIPEGDGIIGGGSGNIGGGSSNIGGGCSDIRHDISNP